jgi:tetratricopeptide (TPR) repeat protein
MKTRNSVVLAVVLAVAAVGSGCQGLQARDQLNKGVAQFKLAKFSEAVNHFRQATDLDPGFITARLYLGMAYMQQYIPGAESPENMEYAKSATAEFMKVLETEPNNATAIASIATLNFHQKKLAEAEEWYRKLIAADPKAKEGYYTLGVIAWTKSYAKRMEARNAMKMSAEDPGPLKDVKVRESLGAELLPIINSGLESLNKALEIDPLYDDATAYLNILHRERADFGANAEAYKKDTEAADAWVQKNLEIKKIKAEKAAKAAAAGIHTGQ